MSNEAEAPERRSIIETLARQYNMEASKFQQMVQATCFPASPPASPEEFAAGMQIAHRLQLNPITKEVHFARTQGGGIQAIIGVDGWYTMANRHPQYDGCEFAYEWINGDGPKKLMSVTCRIFRKDRTRPIEITEYMAECVRPSQAWKLTPSRMLRHRAFGQCARVAFSFAGVMDHDEFERWQEEATPPVKRMSSYAAKREPNGDSTAKFNELLPKLENAVNADTCTDAWKSNAEMLKTAPGRWFNMLSEAYVMRMKDFGVTIEVDDYSWPIFDNETLEAIKNAQSPAEPEAHQAENGASLELSDQAAAPFDKEAAEAALAGFTAELGGAHTLNKITRVWNKWKTAHDQCDSGAQLAFLLAKAAAMKRVKDAEHERDSSMRDTFNSPSVAAE